MTRPEQTDRASGRLGFWRHKGGNIALITALVMIPLTFALGMAFDFTMSRSRQDKLDGIADAAVLGAVTPTQMALACTTAATQAQSLFNGQKALVGGVTAVTATISGCPDTSSSSGNVVSRTITINYTGQSQNVFAALLGMPTLTVKGSSTATSSTAPNINFYLLLDTSPSMELAASSAGISAMQADTTFTQEGTCAFGCHQINPAELTSGTCTTHTDPATHMPTNACQYLTSTAQLITCTTSGNYADSTPFTTSSVFPENGGRDFYDLSLCLGVPLRIDLLRNGVQTLMTFANTAEQTNHATYQMALYETDFNQPNSSNDLNVYSLQALTGDLTGTAYTAAGNISALEMYTNNNLAVGDTSNTNNDRDTTLDADVTQMAEVTSGNPTPIMPTPGNGAAGSTPQEVLFIVTDGMNDEPVSSGGTCGGSSTRLCAPLDWNGAICSAIKARGIRIAVLYTTYNPSAGAPWYADNVGAKLPTGLPPAWADGTPANPSDPMALGAQQCASSGLFYEVSNDADIAAALQTLFQEAVATARLSH